MARRILAGVLTVLAILAVTPDPLSGEPTTTTASSAESLLGIPDDSVPNPLRLYPRRPGAKYEDVEAAPRAAVTLLGSWMRPTHWAIKPRTSLPDLATPARAAPYETLGLVSGYDRLATNAAGDVLKVVVRVTSTLVGPAVSCVATAANNGVVFLPFTGTPRPPERSSQASTKRTSVNLILYFPIGASRGRLYLTCYNGGPGLAMLFTSDGRAVWAIDA